MSGCTFWGRVINFARGLFIRAAPHIPNVLSRAQPHAEILASKALDFGYRLSDRQVHQTLKSSQEGEEVDIEFSPNQNQRTPSKAGLGA